MSDLENICLTCLSDKNVLMDVCLPVIENDNSVSLLDALKTCIPSQMIFSDSIPKKICDKCKILLEISYTFHIQVLESHEKLKKLKALPIKIELDLKTENYNDTKDEFSDYYDISSEPKTEIEDSETKNGNEIYECDKCTKIYVSKDSYENHLHTHEGKQLCPICKKFYKYNNFEKHFEKHNLDIYCKICNKRFKKESLLLQHMLSHDQVNIKEEEMKCTQCDLTFNNSRLFNIHQKEHISLFKCDICNKEFTAKGMLRRHVKLHTENNKYCCSKCPKSYSRRDQLIDHMNNHNGVKPNVCTYCNKAFNQLCNLKDHIRTHTGETPFLCSQCGKGFNNSSNLRQHMMRHTGVKPFSCALCPKTFCTKGQMTSHMITHTDAQPFKCEECGAGFTMSSSLKKHKMIHLGIRAFECDACPRRFVNKDHLKRHYRIHTGEKPFKCKFCERSFTQSNDLIKHTRLHVGQNIYECTVCYLRFRLKSELKRHYPVHYVNNEAPVYMNVTNKYAEPIQKEDECDKIINESNQQNNTITISYNDILDKNGDLTGNITININGEKS